MDGSGFCPQHQQDRLQWDNAQRTKARRNRRGLSTNTARWKRLRLAVLAGEPLCRMCAEAGRITLARAVNHIDGDSGNNELSNLQPLCLSCHTRKTNQFDGGFGNPKRAFRA
ncbi:hypothetical protein CDEF62S_00632 [Castellaniella defragrans]